MSKDYKLRGNRILVAVPNRTKSPIEVDANTKEALEREMLVALGDLKVIAIGDTITDIKKGDKLLIDPGPLSKAPKIPQLCTEEETVVLVSPFDVILKWLN